MPEMSSGEVGLAFLQAFWDGDVDRGLALCSDDARWTFQKSLRAPRYASIHDAVAWLNDTLIVAFDPDTGYEVDVHHCFGSGEEAVVEYTARGKNGEGNVYENNYVVRFTVQDGKILSVRPYFDTLYVHRRLAALPDNDNE